MFDIGFTELLVIGVVALIVVGPRDLPGMFRTLGRFTAKARGMAREFQRAMEDAADDSGMADVAKDLKKVTSPKSLGLDALKNSVSDYTEPFDPEASRKRIEEAKAFDAEGKAAAEQAEDGKAAKKAPARKAPAKKRAEKKTSATAAAEKPARAATPAKTPAKKPATGKAEPKPAAAKKPATKKPVAKKPAAKTSAAAKAETPKPASKPASTTAAKAKSPTRKPAARKPARKSAPKADT